MTRLESTIVGTVLALLPPVMLFIAAGVSACGIWLLTGSYLPEKTIGISALAGLFSGMVLDCLFLTRWTRNVYRLKTWLLVAAYLGCAIIGFAVCMGVPVFHPLLGGVAGLYVGRRLAHTGAEPEQVERAMRRMAIFVTVVMLAICVLSGTVAMLNPTTPGELQRMFNTPFTVSWPMVVGLILGGGAALVLLQYWLARQAVALAYGKPPIPNS